MMRNVLKRINEGGRKVLSRTCTKLGQPCFLQKLERHFSQMSCRDWQLLRNEPIAGAYIF
ncbi:MULTISPECIES: hypothetical protein [Prevotella]|uniref:hypothetical protein n=1 Tax=Prevotella TaxID=838 RepID=UPI001EF09CB7|nr:MULTISPECIES: hypothetical protein [Prevotella]